MSKHDLLLFLTWSLSSNFNGQWLDKKDLKEKIALCKSNSYHVVTTKTILHIDIAAR